MFKCAAGHQTAPGEKLFRVPVTVRRTDDEHLHGYRPNKESFVFCRYGFGHEIVHEEFFCAKHVQSTVPVTVGGVVHKIHFHLKRLKRK